MGAHSAEMRIDTGNGKTARAKLERSAIRSPTTRHRGW